NPHVSCPHPLSTGCPIFAIPGGGGPRISPVSSTQLPGTTLLKNFRRFSGFPCRPSFCPQSGSLELSLTIGLSGRFLSIIRATEAGLGGPVFVPIPARIGGILARPLGP